MNVNLGTTERIIGAVIGLILLSLVFVGPHTWGCTVIDTEISDRRALVLGFLLV